MIDALDPPKAILEIVSSISRARTELDDFTDWAKKRQITFYIKTSELVDLQLRLAKSLLKGMLNT